MVERDLPTKGDQFRHPDGTVEVVFATAEGRLLTVKEYADEDAFRRGVADAEAAGRHEGVQSLPDPEAFEDVEF
jgi:hypothetical protein